MTWKEGEGRRGYKERKPTRLAPIPPGAKTLKLEVGGRLSQAGFITRSPGVAVDLATMPIYVRGGAIVPVDPEEGGIDVSRSWRKSSQAFQTKFIGGNRPRSVQKFDYNRFFWFPAC